MKVLLYGDQTPGHGGWCYAETLREMGHEIEVFSDRTHLEAYCSSLSRRFWRKMTGRLLESDRLRHVHQFADFVLQRQPQLIIVLKGLYLGRTDIQGLRDAGTWICNINHDDFFSANRNNWSWIQRYAIPSYNFIFATREVNVAEIRHLNPNVEFFPFAYFPRIHRVVPIPATEEHQWSVDVVFVGTYEQPRARLLEALVSHAPLRCRIYGSQWNKLAARSPLRPCVVQRELYFDEMAKALRGAKVAMGFLRKENRDDYTQRTFEIPACGGVLVAERTRRHLTYYKEGEEAQFFDVSDPNELCASVSALVRDDVRREAMRSAGQLALHRQRHTYKDRLERLFDVFDNVKGTT